MDNKFKYLITPEPMDSQANSKPHGYVSLNFFDIIGKCGIKLTLCRESVDPSSETQMDLSEPLRLSTDSTIGPTQFESPTKNEPEPMVIDKESPSSTVVVIRYIFCENEGPASGAGRKRFSRGSNNRAGRSIGS